MQQRKLFLIIDGSSLLSTSFYGTVGPAYLMAKTEEDKAKALEKLFGDSYPYLNAISRIVSSLVIKSWAALVSFLFLIYSPRVMPQSIENPFWR